MPKTNKSIIDLYFSEHQLAFQSPSIGTNYRVSSPETCLFRCQFHQHFANRFCNTSRSRYPRVYYSRFNLLPRLFADFKIDVPEKAWKNVHIVHAPLSSKDLLLEGYFETVTPMKNEGNQVSISSTF